MTTGPAGAPPRSAPERDSQWPRLVLATANQHKLVELTRILQAGQVEVELLGLGEFPGAPDVRETGATFADNALLKARAITEFTGLPSVADDSGLCVDALNGMPGVLSARWAGRHGDDEANLRLVLAQLADVLADRRGAQFACVAALVLPSGREHVSEGIMCGRLIHEPRGENGFGYDPIFVADSANPSSAAPDFAGPASTEQASAEQASAEQASAEQTNAQLSPEAKDRISHRGQALRGLAPVIAALLG